MKAPDCSNIKQLTQKSKRGQQGHGITKQTAWAYWMQAIEPKSPELMKAFPGYHPLWVQHSQKMNVGAKNFEHLRRNCLLISQEQAAAYLRTSIEDVQAWESGRLPVPFMAFELLRLVLESSPYRLSNAMWDGWFIAADGYFVSPNVGRFAITPRELGDYAALIGERDRLRAETRSLTEEVEALRAENATLRTLFQTSGVTRELEAMQAKLAGLMERINTASVIPFPAARDQRKATA